MPLCSQGSEHTDYDKKLPHNCKFQCANQSLACGFYIYSSMPRNSRLKKTNKMQRHADIYLLLNCSTCFGLPSRPSSGVHKTVVSASGTDHTICGASSTCSLIVQFYILLMMGAMDTRNMQSNLAVINICIQLQLVGFLQPGL